MASRRSNKTMTLVELRDFLDQEAPFTTADDYSKVYDRRYALGAELGFSKLDVLRSRLAESWEPTAKRGKRR